ncbi:MAG: hypothetical protein VKL59_08535 [Nostocaceae cyanobacterium]|nr:hypothetical protein [Nostocaceae cyanobacterium]
MTQPERNARAMTAQSIKLSGASTSRKKLLMLAYSYSALRAGNYLVTERGVKL